jgi:hypothetical protein
VLNKGRFDKYQRILVAKMPPPSPPWTPNTAVRTSLSSFSYSFSQNESGDRRRTTPHPYKRDNSSKSLSTKEAATAVAATVAAVDAGAATNLCLEALFSGDNGDNGDNGGDGPRVRAQNPITSPLGQLKGFLQQKSAMVHSGAHLNRYHLCLRRRHQKYGAASPRTDIYIPFPPLCGCLLVRGGAVEPA